MPLACIFTTVQRPRTRSRHAKLTIGPESTWTTKALQKQSGSPPQYSNATHLPLKQTKMTPRLSHPPQRRASYSHPLTRRPRAQTLRKYQQPPTSSRRSTERRQKSRLLPQPLLKSSPLLSNNSPTCHQTTHQTKMLQRCSKPQQHRSLCKTTQPTQTQLQCCSSTQMRRSLRTLNPNIQYHRSLWYTRQPLQPRISPNHYSNLWSGDPIVLQ